MYKFIYPVLWSLLACLAIQPSLAQQDPMYTQYMFNGLMINPAYAGSHESLSLTALTRKQWVDLPGSPLTFTFSAHAPLKNKVSLGGSLMHDRIGSTVRNGFTGVYAYQIPMGVGRLSLGLQGTVMTYRTDEVTARDLGDPYAPNMGTTVLPDVGAGAYYYTDKFFAGVSAPSLLNMDAMQEYDGRSIRYTQFRRHYFGYVGYVFTLSESVKFKPNILTKYVQNAPWQFDFNANFLLQETFSLGFSYRTADAFSILAEFQLKNPALRIGLAYDQAMTRLSAHQYGTYEIVLNYRIFGKKEILLTPRYF